MRARQTESERRIAAIEELVQRLETAADPATRAVSQELVRAVMELHGTALERMLSSAVGGLQLTFFPAALAVAALAGGLLLGILGSYIAVGRHAEA